MFDLIDNDELAGVNGGQQTDPIQPQLPVPMPGPKNGPNGPNPGPCFPRPPWPAPENPRQPNPLPIPTKPDPIY